MRFEPALFLLVIAVSFALSAYYLYPERKLQQGTQIDRLAVCKSQRRILAYADGKLIKAYTVAKGNTPVGARNTREVARPQKEYTPSMTISPVTIKT
ncbi:hypothetical protein [Pontibacter pamirensis]|uniref:hypothetical protein n=1 Tax=Pontibacter pamirensis TaxID=2562824 RepID=UPI00138A6158|nr:hypothetical protein [Pontibacter pamirensis]